MNGLIFAVVAALVAAARAACWVAARRRAPRPSAQQARVKAGGPFGGVQIRTRANACRAAQLLGRQRFLTKDAPALPLPECTAERCSCTFSKLSDRRTDGRRLDHGGLSASLFQATTRRKKRDRRRAAHSTAR
jgi:hypothetical protein